MELQQATSHGPRAGVNHFTPLGSRSQRYCVPIEFDQVHQSGSEGEEAQSALTARR
jgi:hypothetical protein